MSSAPITTAQRTSSWLDAPRTWWTILRISLEERLVYRGDFMLGTLMRFLPLITQIFLWKAIFAANGNQPIAGYTYEEFIAYYLLATVARAFSSMPGLSGFISRSIRDGSVKKFLVQPVDMVGFLFLSRVAHKLVYYSVALIPFAIVFFICRSYLPPLPGLVTWAAFIASLIMGFLLGYFIEACIGMAGFWFLEISSLLFVYMLFNFFFSGQMFPLDMLSGWWKTMVSIIPLQYLAYFPAAVYLGKIQGADLAWGLAIEFAWVVFFILFSRAMFHYGVKRYSGFGG